jgi:hypothetical protein
MAKLKDLKVTIGLEKKGLRKLNADLNGMKRRFSADFGAIAGMAKNVAAVIGTTLVAGIGILIKKGAEMETLRTGFISIAGGANKAAAIVKELNDFTAKTPFQLEQVSSAARQLLAVGTQRNELQDQLKMLGDIAASSGQSIEDIAAIFAKVQAKGKVELENLNQLAERGIPIFDQLRTVTGDANMEFGAGAVSVEQFNEALGNMTKEGGLAAGAMENLSKTVEGRISTLMDNLGIELAKAAEKTGITSKFGKLLESATESLRGLSGVAQSDVAAALGLAEEAMEGFGTASTNNLDEVEQKMAAASKAISEIMAASSGGPSNAQVGLIGAMNIMGLGGLAPGMEEAKEQAAALKPLLEMQKMLAQATGDLNNQVLSGTLAQGDVIANTETETAAKQANKKVKEELVQMERSHLLELGKAKELHPVLAEDILASTYANHELKGSFEAVATAVQLPMDRMVAMAQYAGNQLPQFFSGAFDAIADSTQSFGDYVMETLERLLKKALALAAAFGVISLITGGSGGAALGGFKGFMMGGMGLGGIPQMADGGIFTGASLAMVGEGPGTSSINPEVVAPLNKLRDMMGGNQVQVTGVIRGQDILLTNERSAIDRNRLRSF